MTDSHVIEEIKRNVVLGHMDADDEGFDGGMQGTPGVVELVKKAADDGVPMKTLLDALSVGMQIVGERFESGEYLIPDMLASAESVGTAMDVLEPFLAKERIASKGTFVIATVEGDLHDIGKNIVATMLRGDGYDIRDLGTGVGAAAIVEAVREHRAPFLGLSALLTTTMVHMQPVIELLKEQGLRDSVTVLIGGAPTSTEFAEKIGADAHCADAFAAMDVMRRLRGEEDPA